MINHPPCMEERKNMRTFLIIVSGSATIVNFINVAIGMLNNNYPKATFSLILLICSGCWLIMETEHK